MKRIVFVILLVLLSPLAWWYAADARKKPAPPKGKDYSDQLPRIPPTEPAKALASFQTRPGFRIDLVAAEPLLRSPVAMDFDENGRLFVVEFPEYNEYGSKKPHGRGRVRLLEDTDGDGTYDRSTVYADDLDSP